jgi:uroporphyrinogen decarboxylase
LETSPLAGPLTAAAVARYPWPDPTDPGRFRTLRERALALRASGDYAIIYNARINMVHMTQYVRGFEDWFRDLAAGQDLFLTMMEAVTENLIELNRRATWASRTARSCSPSMYRKLIRPFQKRALDAARSLTRAKFLYHT